MHYDNNLLGVALLRGPSECRILSKGTHSGCCLLLKITKRGEISCAKCTIESPTKSIPTHDPFRVQLVLPVHAIHWESLGDNSDIYQSKIESFSNEHKCIAMDYTIQNQRSYQLSKCSRILELHCNGLGHALLQDKQK